MTDAELYALTSPIVARLSLAAMQEVAAMRGEEAPAEIDGALVHALNALADNISVAASGYDLFVAARCAGVIGEACSRAQAESEWGGVDRPTQEFLIAVGYWSDRMNWQARQMHDDAA